MSDKRVELVIGVKNEGLGAIDRVIDELDRAGSETADFREEARKLRERLAELERQQQLIDQFVRLKREAGKSADALEDAQAKAQALGRQLRATGEPTRRQQRDFERARAAVKQASDAYEQARLRLQAMRGQLSGAGIESTQLAVKQRALAQGARETQAQLQHLGSRVQAALNQAGDAGDRLAESMDRIGKTRAGVQSISTQLAAMRSQLLSLVGINFGAQLLRDAVQTADAFAGLRSRIQLVTGEGQALESAWEGVSQVALRTHSALEATATLFSRLTQAGRDAGLSTEQASQQALALTETINQAIQVSGASAQASEAAITQLVQGLQGGVLRGDEFNSVMEQSPRLARALADGLGVTVGELRKMAEQGQLTASTVIQALQGQSAAIAAEFEQLPPTVGRSLQDLSTKWTLFIGQLDQSTGATQTVAQGIGWIAQHLDELAQVATRAGAILAAALAVQSAGALRQLSAHMLATAGSARVLTASLNAIPTKINIAIAAVGFEIGWQIGEMLHENSELARKLGAGLNWFFQQVVSGLQLTYEAAKAVFTDDTIDAAWERYRERAAQIRDISADLWRDAAQAPQTIMPAAQAATSAMQHMGQAAAQSGAALATAGAVGAAGIGKITPEASAAADALRALGKDIGVSLPPGTQNAAELARALADIAGKSQEAAARLQADLPAALEKLSGKDLADFKVAYISAMRAAGASTAQLQSILDAVGQQAAKSLGIDVGQSANRMSREFLQARDNVGLLAADFGRLKASGGDAVLLLTQGLQKLTQQARNTHDIDELKKRIEALREKLGEQVTNGLLEQAAQKARELGDELDRAKAGIDSLREAHAELGIQAREELAATAARGVQAYEAIKAAGQQEGESALAWQQRKRQAAEVMIGRLIAANGGVADAAIKARAAQEGVALAIDSVGRATVRTAQQSAQATGEMAQGWQGVAGAVQQANQQVQEYQRRMQQKYGRPGEGEPISQIKPETAVVTGSTDVRNQWIARHLGERHIDDERAQQIYGKQALLDYWRSLGITSSRDGSLEAMRAEVERLKRALARDSAGDMRRDQGREQGRRPGGSDTGGGPSTTVRIQLQGRAERTIRTDADGAREVQALLRELGAAKSRYGRAA